MRLVCNDGSFIDRTLSSVSTPLSFSTEKLTRFFMPIFCLCMSSLKRFLLVTVCLRNHFLFIDWTKVTRPNTVLPLCLMLVTIGRQIASDIFLNLFQNGDEISAWFDGILSFKDRISVSPQQYVILKNLHRRPSGAENMKSLAQLTSWRSKLSRDLWQIAERCKGCARKNWLSAF